jgi:hypothetical protein
MTIQRLNFDSTNFFRETRFLTKKTLETSTGAQGESREQPSPLPPEQRVAQRQGIDLATDMMKTPERRETAIEGKIIEDRGTGYRIWICAPKKWDGTMDAYLPGDTYTLEEAVSSKHLRQKFESNKRKNKQSALVVIEGNRSHIDGDIKSKKQRYNELKSSSKLKSLLGTMESALGGGITSINFMGHSRGGAAINYILQNGAAASKVSTISCLDSTFFSADPLIAFARRGGRLNVAFKLNYPTEASARKIIKELGLKKISSDHWQSADGKVNVYSTTQSHSEIADHYSGIFMGTEHQHPRDVSFVPTQEDLTYEYTNPVVETTENQPGALHAEVLKRVGEVATMKEDDERLMSANIEDIRFNTRLLTQSQDQSDNLTKAKNLRLETYRRLKAYTSACDDKWYTLDYARMGSDSRGKAHEMFVGLGDILLDPDIDRILVDRGGEIIIAKRGIVNDPGGKHNGRLGFTDEETGQYVATHTGDKFRILTGNESDLSKDEILAKYMENAKKEDDARIAEKSLFEQNPSAYSDDPGYYAGKTVENYQYKPGSASEDDKSQKEKTVIPPEVTERDVPFMGYDQAYNYYHRLCGRPPKKGWLMSKIDVFNTTVNNPNIIMACLLVELEERCKLMGMNLKFKKGISVYADKKKFHGLGLAVDFDPEDNALNLPENTKWTIPFAMAKEMQKMGFGWGMYYKSRPDRKTDPMHFDLRTSLPNAIGMLTSERALKLAKSLKVPDMNMSLYDYGKSLGGKIH